MPTGGFASSSGTRSIPGFNHRGRSSGFVQPSHQMQATSSRLGARTITAIGAGGVSATCAAQRGIAAGDVAAALHAAIEAGIDLFEIAAEEPAERLIGEAIRTL